MIKRSRRKLVGLFLVVALLLGVPALFVARQMRQEYLDVGLLRSIRENEPREAVALLKQGANPNVRELPVDTRSFWQRLLALLIPSQRTATTYTPTPLATLCEDLYLSPYVKESYLTEYRALVKMLLVSGANVNEKDQADMPLLIKTIDLGKIVQARLLIEFGADTNCQDQNGDTPLAYAAAKLPKIIPALLDKGAEINRRHSGITALMVAADNGTPDAVKYLLRGGADVQLRDKQGRTALYYAQGRGHTQIVSLLKQAGARP
jgi:hypothetical protein